MNRERNIYECERKLIKAREDVARKLFSAQTYIHPVSTAGKVINAAYDLYNKAYEYDMAKISVREGNKRTRLRDNKKLTLKESVNDLLLLRLETDGATCDWEEFQERLDKVKLALSNK